MPRNNKDAGPQWVRWHKLPPDLASALASGQSRLYLALHAYSDSLAVLAVPAADRITLSHLETTHVTMTVVRVPPSCSPRGQTHRRDSGQRKR